MVTNEERKEIVAKLRNFRWDVFARNDSDFRKVLNELIDIDYYDKRTGILCSHGATWERLANLIEPEPEKTCKNNDGYCSECGQELVGYTKKISVDDEQNIAITFAVRPYCCRCGAKVKS